MTLRDWLRTRQPAPPAALLARMEEALGPLDADVRGEVLAERALVAAEQLLATVLDDPEGGRARALDLLAVDALVTYAFEAESAAGIDVEARGREAMARLAALGAEHDAAAGGR